MQTEEINTNNLIEAKTQARTLNIMIAARNKIFIPIYEKNGSNFVHLSLFEFPEIIFGTIQPNGLRRCTGSMDIVRKSLWKK